MTTRKIGFFVLNEYLYIGTSDYYFTGCQVYRSENGMDWVSLAKNSFYDSYIRSRNWYVGAMEFFNGQLYVGTGSEEGFPCELWRTNFPVTPVKMPVLNKSYMIGALVTVGFGIYSRWNKLK